MKERYKGLILIFFVFFIKMRGLFSVFNEGIISFLKKRMKKQSTIKVDCFGLNFF